MGDGSQKPAPRTIDGRYEVTRVLGEGAAARTLLCRDVELDREVAVKELRVEHLDDWKYLELFEREARVLAGLRHHAIPEVLGSFEAKDESNRPVLYLVQEFIEGASLARRLAEGPSLGQVELIQLALGILDVLEYLHGRSPPIYHRDIKPSNIIVRSTSAPVLVDFGSVTHGWRPSKQAGSTVTGTFGYMPPEQLLGHVGATSDLYALGATLLHSLTGRSPTEFSFETGRIEVPSDLPAPAGLRLLVHALLEPAPRDRPQNVAAAREILLVAGTQAATNASTALATIHTQVPARIGGKAPRMVDAGPPPRDPMGEFEDVYRHLVDPFGATIVSRWGRFSLLLLCGIGTLGILPVVYLADMNKRRRHYEGLFREGELVRGTLRALQGHPHVNTFSTLVYDYVVNGAGYRGYFDLPMSKSKYLTPGDPVTVAYSARDPARSCLLFRHPP